ncbi:TolC family protein [Acidicapsa acidisoli]|uniref:TolC family protein n=1 Tax=Acidicapsa acidisoli TaxID=1615681 RepID=UPI0021E010CF|nr:TolC family protein [Acidicapsa acidisoli]
MQNLLHPPAVSNRTTLFATNLVIAALATFSIPATAQINLSGQQSAPTPPPASSYQGSVTNGAATTGILSLTLDEAVQRGLQTNLGLLLSNTNISGAKGQRLQDLQALLPSIDASAKEAYEQSDLAAEGLKIPGFPTIIGPFGYTDIRANLTWSVLNLNSLKTYMAARHYFQASQLSADDARQMVILTVGNAYLRVLADQAQIESTQAQVETSKVSLDQAVSNHSAGTAPRLDELRAQVDNQSLQQQLIVARNTWEKDKLALARAIGLPLAQNFELADKAPYSAFDQPDVQVAIKQALANRKDRQASAELTKANVDQRKAATDDRLPTIKAEADYGDIGVNVRHSHGTVDATGTITIPIFKEAQFRGEAQVAQSQLDQQLDQQSDLDAQIEADVRDSLLDIASSQQQVEVSHSNVELSNEVLSEAQQRYSAGVSDNLAVSQAQQTVAQANSQYINSLYQHNLAKLNLARAMGVAQNYKEYLGGK